MTSPSVDEGDAVDPEVGEMVVGRALQALPDDAREVAPQPARVAVRVVAELVEMERDPADDVVLRVLSAAGQRVVDGEQELGVEARRERGVHVVRVELRTWIRGVRAERQVAVESALNPAREVGHAVVRRRVEVDEAERARRTVLSERERRLAVEARAAGAGEVGLELVDDDRRRTPYLLRDAGAGGGGRMHRDGVDREELREEARRGPVHADEHRVVRFVVAAEVDARRCDAAVGKRVPLRKRRRLRRVGGKRLRACERRFVCSRLRLALLAIPRPHVECQRSRREQDDEEQDADHERLAVLGPEPRPHSSGSVIVLVRLPEATTRPSRLIEYGYVTVTTMSVPAFVHVGSVGSSAVTFSCDWSRLDAAFWTAVWTSPELIPVKRATIAVRAPARAASVIVR